MNTCTDCGSTDIIRNDADGNRFCKKCGLVVGEEQLSGKMVILV